MVRTFITLTFGFAALMASSFFILILRRWANRRHLLAIPGERSSHTQPTPVGAGLAIVAVVLTGLVAYAAIHPPNPPWFHLSVYVIGALAIAVIGWLDDIYDWPVHIRLIVQVLAALLFVTSFGYWHSVNLPLYGEISLGWLGAPLTFCWIVGLTNAYNFMDGSDGIAGGQTLVAGLAWGLFGVLSGQWIIGILGLLLTATSIGFLTHNWPPATIFMGDVGSTFLGYTLAVMAVIGAQGDSRLAFVGVLIVWAFVFDTGYTFLRRLIKKENVFRAHRSHLYQRLLMAGNSHRFVALLYVYLALAGVCVALAWYLHVPGGEWFAVIAIFLLAIGLRAFVYRQEHRLVATQKQH